MAPPDIGAQLPEAPVKLVSTSTTSTVSIYVSSVPPREKLLSILIQAAALVSSLLIKLVDISPVCFYCTFHFVYSSLQASPRMIAPARKNAVKKGLKLPART